MATSEFWQRTSTSASSSREWTGGLAGDALRGSQAMARLWMALDAITIVASAVVATLYYRMRKGPVASSGEILQGTFVHQGATGLLLALFLCFFAVSLMLISRRLNLYSPTRLNGILNEQRRSVQACLTSGLLLTGVLYLMRASFVHRSIVLVAVGLVTIGLSLRRLAYRLLLYRGFEHGVGTRNVLIVGTGPNAMVLRFYLESIRHLGYRFKGFIASPDSDEFPGSGARFRTPSSDQVGTLDTLFQQVRKLFIDEVFFATHCEPSVVADVLEQARALHVDLRMVPELPDGLAMNSPIEYVGQFPTVPLHRGQATEVRRALKRALDIVISSMALIFLSPVLMVIAIAIKLDSRGPVFSSSERAGSGGRVFRCFKFRTVVCGAERQRGGLSAMSECGGLPFKIAGNPCMTRLGRFLRRHSLDEFPQFFNVLRGEMSVVGPRPLPAGVVRDSRLAHQRVLAVPPGITGLWQMQGLQDPSPDGYVSLNGMYIENWSIWLDLKIILRAIGVVLAGAGA
jgi:exopolysaccharide biosynthesis polyprenyl glycosylphosphotransferase